MDFRQIRYFLNLTETLNFTRAAALSQVTQPALTKAIQKLEEEIGGQLLFRDGKDTRLTELGRTIRGEFEKIPQRPDNVTIRERPGTKLSGKLRPLFLLVKSSLCGSGFISWVRPNLFLK